MSDTPTENADVSELAQQVVAELKPGTTIADKVILSRRQLVAIAGGSISVGALMKFGVSEAQAQEAVGAVGTEEEPVDVEANLINSGGPIVDGDGIERNLFVIAEGEDDPERGSGFEIPMFVYHVRSNTPQCQKYPRVRLFLTSIANVHV